MNTLKHTNHPGVYRIMAPAFCAALTRSGGEPSDSLHARLCLALGNVADVELDRGPSGRWYVRAARPQDRNRTVCVPTATLEIRAKGCANESHQLRVAVASMPEDDDFLFDSIADDSCTLYFAECQGFVRYYAHSPSNENGFSGREFTLNMRDGSVRTIKGPWSSRSEVMNEHFDTPCIEASIKTDKYNNLAGNITVELAEELAATCNAQIVQDDHRYSVEPVALDIAPVADFNRAMVAKHGTS